MSASDLPGQAGKPRSRRPPLAPELAPVVEAMWREGMLYHEIAELFDTSCEAVHRLIRERQRRSELTATARSPDDQRSQEERLLAGVRRAARVLADTTAVKDDERRRAQALIDRWLVAHPQLTAAAATSPSRLPEVPTRTSPRAFPSPADLHGALDRFKADLRAGGLRESTIHAYLMGATLFVRWLAGDYVPGPRRTTRSSVTQYR